MNPWAIIPLVSCVAYAILLILVLLQTRRPASRVFAVFLLASGMWSLTSFMLTYNSSASTQTLIFWNELLFAAAMWTIIAYYHFVRVYNNKSAGIWAYIGYAIILTILIFAFTGDIVKDAYIIDGHLYHDVGYWVFITSAILLPIFFVTMWMLLQRYRRSADPVDRNRTMYLMIGLGIMAMWAGINVSVPMLALLPTDHIGVFFNALIIAYAISKYHLLNIRFVARRAVAYLMLIAILIGICTGIVFIGQRFFQAQESVVIVILFATSSAILLVVAARPLRYMIQKYVDRIFYRETYEYRQTLLDFSTRMSNILSLEQLVDEMLPAITKALYITQAKLLFQDTGSNDFTTHFTYPKTESALSDKLRFNSDNPIIAWLEKETNPLYLKQIDSIPEFKGLWQTEREILTTSKLELLCPIKSRDKLIGILALGGKESNSPYSYGKIQLLMNVTSQAGILIENAQLYSQALVRANTDELTGLYNHRHFHERLEQEVARGSRFGAMFSLIILDVDLFKAYNDIYGHLAGDEVLRRIGECIRSSIRTIDLAFRYGGEEFTVILPETRLDDAYRVAERIRKTIESKTSSKAMPVTVSLGIANWPIDGVMREEIISRADAALYQAKQTGRNRTCLSSDIGKPETPLIGVELEAKPRALSIIYALAATVDAKDHYTYGHSRKVSDYSVAIAEALGLSQDRIAIIRAAGLLHDIGKIGIPDFILNKKGALTDEEWGVIKVHPELGVEILRHVIDLVNCLPAILHHHEHYDGSGYSSGLKGDSIPLEARILTITDAYDAMTSLRPYRKQLSSQQALNELKRCSGTHFDSDLVDIFCSIIESTPLKKLETK